MYRTILMLVASNIFMTYAWYGMVKVKGLPLWKMILISWGIAFFEYCLMIPANKNGFEVGMSGFQLKITQEVITLLIFTFFAVLYLKEPIRWNYMISFVCILGAVYFAFKK